MKTRFAIALLALLFCAALPVSVAQDCTPVKGIGQALVFFNQPINQNDLWGGPFYMTLDGTAGVMTGIFSGQDGTDVWNGQNGMMGKGKGGRYSFALNFNGTGYQDSFTTEVTNAVFGNPPGKIGFGYYQASHNIVSGTGRFKNATGHLVVAGTYVFFPYAGDANVDGRWNPDVTGKICGILPAE